MAPPEPPQCDFCAIARDDDESVEVIASGDAWVAFFPLDPATPGHTLLIPRIHVTDFWSADPDLGAALARAAIGVGRAIDEALEPEGMNLITSAGSAAEQTVFHLHLHVVPRWRADGFGRIWPKGDRYQNDVALDVLADEIRSAYRAL